MQFSGLLALYFETGPPPVLVPDVIFTANLRSTVFEARPRNTVFTANVRPTTFEAR